MKPKRTKAFGKGTRFDTARDARRRGGKSRTVRPPRRVAPQARKRKAHKHDDVVPGQGPSVGMILAAIGTFASAAAVMGVLIWTGVIRDFFSKPHVHPVPKAKPALVSPATLATGNDFTKSYERLSAALSGFPNVRTEDVIRAAKDIAPEASAGCALRWVAGEAALQYGQQGGDSALAATVSHCADAVEALHRILTADTAEKRRTASAN